MSHQRMHGDPRSTLRTTQLESDPWEGRQGLPQGYRGGSYENAGHQGAVPVPTKAADTRMWRMHGTIRMATMPAIRG